MRQRKEMRKYQSDLATFLYEHDHCFCVVRPGGGKTIAALTAAEELIRDKVISHVLVIAPKRVANKVWPDEIELWQHVTKLRYTVLTGPPMQRELELTRIAVHMRDVTIVGIDLVQWLVAQLDKQPADSPLFDLLIIDEASRLRNPTGKRAKELAKRSKKWQMIWGLSGTLRPSSAMDLFTPARVVLGDKFWGKSFYKWRQERFYPTDFHGYVWAPMPGAEEKIHAELAPHTITLDDGNMPELPKLSIVYDRFDLPDDARRQYDSMESRLITGAGETVIVAATAAIATGKLAQMANGFVYDEHTKAELIHQEKVNWLVDLVEEATGPTLLIYEYLQDLAIMREVVGNDLPYLGAGVSDKQATRNIEDWNAGQLPFMALHPASGGHGLNLQDGGADMAWMAPTWSPELWEQTIARLHRSGQTRPVIVRVCVASNTVDEMKMLRVADKMTAQEAFEAYLRRRQRTRNFVAA